jgi:hypothetical protein
MEYLHCGPDYDWGTPELPTYAVSLRCTPTIAKNLAKVVHSLSINLYILELCIRDVGGPPVEPLDG